MTDPDKPLPSLEELQKDIDKLKPHKQDESPEKVPSSDVGKAMRVAGDLMAGVVVGGAIGYGIDKWCHTSPVFFILFFFIGFVAGVRNLMRGYKESERSK